MLGTIRFQLQVGVNLGVGRTMFQTNKQTLFGRGWCPEALAPSGLIEMKCSGHNIANLPWLSNNRFRHCRYARQVEDFLGRMEFQEWIGASAEIKVRIVRHVRDWKGFFEKLGVHPTGGLREDAVGLHTFLFLRRKGHDNKTAVAPSLPPIRSRIA
jgi:hypothetical protein